VIRNSASFLQCSRQTTCTCTQPQNVLHATVPSRYLTYLILKIQTSTLSHPLFVQVLPLEGILAGAGRPIDTLAHRALPDDREWALLGAATR
jgi:hypothetical protein